MSTILTLHLDEHSQAHFEQMRQQHFPPERNLVPAHLTLFHTLPEPPEVSAALAEVASRWTQFPLRVNGLRSLGRGVAYTLDSPALLVLHRELAARFGDHLTPQDLQKLNPHVVIQNKATPESARLLLAKLRTSFVPFEAEALGLDLWQYLSGPWALVKTFSFKDA